MIVFHWPYPLIIKFMLARSVFKRSSESLDTYSASVSLMLNKTQGQQEVDVAKRRVSGPFNFDKLTLEDILVALARRCSNA